MKINAYLLGTMLKGVTLGLLLVLSLIELTLLSSGAVIFRYQGF